MTIVRQRVPGVHDVISPEGRVCVELLDDRGRVKQKVKSENAIMNIWNDGQKRNVRGGDTAFTVAGTTLTGYHFHGNTVALSSEIDSGRTGTDWWFRGLAGGWQMLGHPSAFQDGMRNVILTDSTDTVDADEFIFPGDMNAYTNLREQYAPSTGTKRGNLNTTTSYRTPTSLRYVCEWGTAYGNGTHNSVGIGNVVHATALATQAYPCLTPYISSMSTRFSTPSDVSNGGSAIGLHHNHAAHGDTGNRYFATPLVPVNPNTSMLSGHRVALDEFWTVQSFVAANNMAKKDMSAMTISPWGNALASSGHVVTGPTNTTIGSGVNKTAVTVVGSDLWLAYQGTLKRCVKPTGTSLTVTDTYTPGGIENCSDITTDGVDIYWLGATTVYKIDPATGGITASWAHGLTGNMGTLCWGGPNSSYLLVNYEATSLPNASTHVSITARSSWLTALFTTAGTYKGTFQVPSMAYSTAAAASYTTGGLIMPYTADYKHWVGPWGAHANNTSSPGPTAFGPSHMSRTVLGSPVVKTSANSMRVTYEFTF